MPSYIQKDVLISSGLTFVPFNYGSILDYYEFSLLAVTVC